MIRREGNEREKVSVLQRKLKLTLQVGIFHTVNRKWSECQ